MLARLMLPNKPFITTRAAKSLLAAVAGRKCSPLSVQSSAAVEDSCGQMKLDDITDLITSKCRILANPALALTEAENEMENDPVKIFQNCWGWRSTDECRYEDAASQSPTAANDVPVLSRKLRIAEGRLLREIASSILQRGWNETTKREFLTKIPHITPFHVCHILKAVQNPGYCTQVFEWAKQQQGYKHTTRSYNALASVLASSRNVTVLEQLQDQMERDGCEPDNVTLCTLIRAYSKAQQPHKVLELYYHMREKQWEPGIVTYSCIIDILAKHSYTDKAREIYFEMRMNGCHLDRTGYNILINLFGKKRNLHMVNRLYKEMAECGLHPDGYTYAAIIQAHLKTGDTLKAYDFFIELLEKNLSMSLSTCNSLICSLGKAREFNKVWKVYNETLALGIEPDAHTYSALLNVLGPDGRISDLHHMIEEMASNLQITSAEAYAKSIEWLVQGGSIDSACKIVLEFMRKQGSADNVAVDVLLRNLLRIGAIDQMHCFLKELISSEVRPRYDKLDDIVKKLADAANVDGALKIFYAIAEFGQPPGCIAYDSILLCLTRFGSLYQAQQFFQDMSKAGIMPTVDTCNYLISVLCIKGDMKAAHDVFNKMVAGGCSPNVGTYSKLIAGHANTSDWAMAFKLSKDMEDAGIVADCETYMPLILSLGNDGRMDHAIQLCKQMFDKGLVPSQQSCMRLRQMMSRRNVCKSVLQDIFGKLKSNQCVSQFLEFTD